MSELVVSENLVVDGTRVQLLTLNRPDDHNPVDAATLAALHSELLTLTQPGGPAAIVLTGAGPSFSAGGDLKGYQSLFRRPEDFRSFIDEFHAVCNLLERCRAITVAMVNGTCVAGGLELALACDVIIAADSARIGDGHLRFSQLPGAGGSQRLLRAIGFQRARFWLLSGRLFSAAEAVEAGLVTEVVAPDRLRQRTFELAMELADHSPMAIEEMKRLIQLHGDTALTAALRTEAEAAWRYATASEDATEGLLAFAERRRAEFKGR